MSRPVGSDCSGNRPSRLTRDIRATHRLIESNVSNRNLTISYTRWGFDVAPCNVQRGIPHRALREELADA